MVVRTITQGVQEHQLDSWREFTDWVATDGANTPAYLWRGQANAAWKLESTLDRLERRFARTRNRSGNIPYFFQYPPTDRRTHLEAFKEAVRNRRGTNAPSLSDDEWWVLGQHHGLATPMLDFTLSPFVALFFAFEASDCCDSGGNRTTPKNRGVFATPWHLLDDRNSNGSPVPTPYSPRGDIGSRLTNQAGVFLRMPEGQDLEAYVRGAFAKETSDTNRHPRAVLQKFIIPDNERKACLQYLNKMNINRMSLFPDVINAAAYINAMWELDFDTSLGALPDKISGGD